MTSDEKKSPGAARAKPARSELTATLVIDERPGGKKFQGVWLEREGAERLVVDYRARGFWLPFANQRVLVTGARYTPHGQAIRASHFRVHTLRMADPSSTAAWVAIGPEQTMKGRLATHTGPAGSKSAGSSHSVFVAEDGTSHVIVNSDWDAAAGEVTIKGRVVERSRYTAHLGGPHIWILDVNR